jgi:hypothetical protein
VKPTLRAFVVLLVAAAGCQAESPPRGPEATCAKACEVQAAARCSSDACARGCNLVLDRLAEHQGDTILGCVASSTSCDDRAWARCGALVGPHADGGPPPPPPPRDVFDDQD